MSTADEPAWALPHPEQKRPWRPLIAEWLPFAYVLCALTVKLLIVGMLLSDLWWIPIHPPFDESLPGAYALTGTLGSLLLLLALPLVVGGRLGLIALGAIYLAVSVVGVADLIHAAYFGCLMPARRLAQVRMLDDIAMATRSQWDFGYAWHFADLLPLLVVLGVAWRTRSGRPRAPGRWKQGALAFAAGLMCMVPMLSVVRSNAGGATGFTGLQGELTTYIGLLPFHALDVAMLARDALQSSPSVARDELTQWFVKHRASTAQPSSLFGVAAGSNLIQISAESLQAFPIGLVVEGQEITPALNALARESLHFTRFFDQTNLGTTADAEFLTHQSLFPLADDVVSQGYESNRWRGSAAILAERGYNTLSACGADAGFWHMDAMHRGLGFSTSYFAAFYHATEQVGSWNWISDRDFLDQNVALLKKQAQPFFAYFLTSSNHDPYDVPAHRRNLDLHTIADAKLVNYLHSVHLFDRVFGEFLERLRAEHLLDNTVLVVYGDHHGFLEDSPDLARILGLRADDRFALWKVRKRVPLFVRLPNAANAGPRTNIGGHLDVAPTALSLLGVPSADEVAMGQDLSGSDSAMVVFRDGSYVDRDAYFINNFGAIERSRCYSAWTDQPVPCAPLAGRRAEAARRLRLSDLIVHNDLVLPLRESFVAQ